MYIEKLYITTFGALKDREYTLSEGFNVIEGNNESGKTTLMNFVIFVLYGADSALNKQMKAASEPFSGSITLFCEKLGRVTVSRTASCIGARTTDTCSVISCDTLKTVSIGKASPGEYILGINREFFENTVFVSQQGASSYSSDEASSAVQNILNSANEKMSTDKGKRKLDETRKNLRHKNNKGGAIFTISSELASLEAELESNKSSRTILAEAEKRLEELAAEQTAIDELPKLIATEKEARKAEKLRLLVIEHGRCLEKKNADEEKLNSVIAKNNEFRQSNAAAEIRRLDVESKMLKSRSEMLLTAVTNAEHELSIMEEGSKSIPQDTDDYLNALRNMSFSAKRFGYAAVAAFCITFLTLILGIISIIFDEIFAAVSLFLSATLALIIGFIMLSFRKNKLNEKYEMLSKFGFSKSAALRDISDEFVRRRQFDTLKKTKQKEIEQLRNDCKSSDNSYNEALHLLNGILNKIVPEHLELDTDIRIELAEAEVSQGLEKEAEIRRSINDCISKITSLEEEISAYKIYSDVKSTCNPDFSPYSDAELDARLHSIIERSRQITDEIHSITVQKTALESRLRQSTDIEADIGEKKMLLQKREEQFSIVLLAQEALEKASGNIRSAVTPNIKKLCDGMFSELTAGRYSHVGLDASLSLNGVSGMETRTDGELSYGTNEAMYLAFRISLCTVLCQKEMPPIMLDETFAHIDDYRTAAMMKMLCGLNAQAVLFTCSKRESNLARESGLEPNVITL